MLVPPLCIVIQVRLELQPDRSQAATAAEGLRGLGSARQGARRAARRMASLMMSPITSSPITSPAMAMMVEAAASRAQAQVCG